MVGLPSYLRYREEQEVKQVPVVLAVLTAVVGLAIGFPLASAIQPTKTVTKTITKPVKIENGEATTSMAKSFGQAKGQLPANTSPVDLSGCFGWIGPMNTTGTPKWVVYTCINPNQK